ncbi:MAG: HNH endonuclease [Burkholderiales bacterium]|nr:HNH endonuclease [Burkholderiales bacterium]
MPRQSKWDGDQITRTHVRAAARLWRSGTKTLGFRESSTYDVYIDGRPYPPKAICALAYELATTKQLSPRDFAGAKDGYWHKILSQWYHVYPKRAFDTELETSADELSALALGELMRRAQEESSDHPVHVEVTTVAYKRSPYVRAAALRRADGVCEGCKRAAPFKKRSNGMPYLEVHHVVPLSRRGADSLDNTVALCPNCHAERHDVLGMPQDTE